MKNLSLTIDLLRENISKVERVLIRHGELVNGLKPSEVRWIKVHGFFDST